MIPTTATNSPNSTPLSTLSPCTPSPMSSTSMSSNGSAGQQQIQLSVIKGIASLILEGRVVADDDYQLLVMRPQTLEHSEIASGSGDVVAGGDYNAGGRQSPKPSTSKAAAAISDSHVINITTNPHAFGAAMPQIIESFSHNQSSPATSADSNHQRWTQKICQLRQASPAANFGQTQDCKLAIETQSAASGEPELVSLAINDSTLATERGDFEIVRRVYLNRANFPTGNNGVGVGVGVGSPSSSPSSTSDNFLHSLQSLATTCLRGGSDTSGYRYSALPTVTPSNKYAQRSLSPRFPCPYVLDLPGSASSSGSGVQSPRVHFSPVSPQVCPDTTCNKKDKVHWPLAQTSCRVTNTLPTTSAAIAVASSSGQVKKPQQHTHQESSSVTVVPPSHPQHGPHCEQFLRKMGLSKSATNDASDTEEHFCNMSYVNITCSRWRAYCQKIEAIIGRSETVCIEVYLGPVSHKILLEQWIITKKEK